MENLEFCDKHNIHPEPFITGIENIVDHKVNIIRCDNGTEFKNREMNQTLIEAARTMLADSKLPTTFWAEAVNTACYVQNRVLVVKPHNKTPYELFHGKFDGKADEGFFVGYSLNSKAFRVFNSRTRIVEENLHIRFSESTPNAVGSGPDWLFDIDALTRTMNYEPIVAGTQSNGFAGTKASDNAGQARKETKHVKDYILLPLWTADPPFSQDPKSSHDDGSKPSSDDGKKVDEDPRKDSECNDQEKEDNVNSTNNVNATSTNEVNAVGGKTSIELPFDPNMPALEDYSIFDFRRDDEDDGVVDDMNNLDTTIQVSPIPTTRIHKDHPLDQMIGDLQSATQTRKMSNMDFVVYQMDVKSAFIYGKIKEEVYVCQPPGFEDPYFPDRVYKTMDFKKGKLTRPYSSKGTKMSSMGELTFFLGLQVQQKKDGIFISQDKYVVEILKKFGFIEVKTASTPMETQKPLLKDEDGEEVDVHMYRSMIGSLMYLTSSRPDIMFAVCACARYQVNPKVSHLHAVKRIFSWIEKSTTGGCQFLGCRLISWQCKKQTVVANSITEAEHTLTTVSYYYWVKVYAIEDVERLSCRSIYRRDLQLEDEEGIDCLPNSTIFEELTRMGAKTTAWNEFSSTMASAIICLAINQKKPKRKDTQVPQPSGPTDIVADEAVHKELGDSLVRAATTASSLEAEQDSGRFENVSKLSNDKLIARGNTLQSDEDILKLKELMELCTNLQQRVLDLEKTKTTQQNEIASLKRRVKKLEKKRSSRTHKLKRLYKFGLTARVESSRDEQSLGEDASKQGRMINAIDVDEDITLVNVQDDADNEMFDVNTLNGEQFSIEILG
ncbi:uncharacterized mitochondrial protein-like protein [Tanacetum coccineum]